MCGDGIGVNRPKTGARDANDVSMTINPTCRRCLMDFPFVHT